MSSSDDIREVVSHVLSRLRRLEHEVEGIKKLLDNVRRVFAEIERVFDYKPCAYRFFTLLPDREQDCLVIRIYAYCTVDSSRCSVRDPRECPKLKHGCSVYSL